MSDPVQSVVNGKKFNEGYCYIYINGNLNKLDESYRYSNCKQVARTKTNTENIYYCQVDPEYIVEKDGAVSLKLLAVSSTLLYFYYMDEITEIEDEMDDQ